MTMSGCCPRRQKRELPPVTAVGISAFIVSLPHPSLSFNKSQAGETKGPIPQLLVCGPELKQVWDDSMFVFDPCAQDEEVLTAAYDIR